MKEPCMCGAIDCRICGPLQGYPYPFRDYDDEEEAMTREEIKQRLEPLSWLEIYKIAGDALAELIKDEDVRVVDGRFVWSEFCGGKAVGTRKDGEHD